MHIQTSILYLTNYYILGQTPFSRLLWQAELTFIRFDATHERDGHTHTHTHTPHDGIGRAYALHRAATTEVSNFCRDAMHKRGLLSACGVCLSVRPSVCHVREFCQNE